MGLNSGAKRPRLPLRRNMMLRKFFLNRRIKARSLSAFKARSASSCSLLNLGFLAGFSFLRGRGGLGGSIGSLT